MTKEEYLSKAREFESNIKTLQRSMKMMRDAYIEEHGTIWPLGAKVKVTNRYRPGYFEYGIVVGVKECSGDILPKLAKVKKDGTAHLTARVSVWDFEDLEIVE